MKSESFAVICAMCTTTDLSCSSCCLILELRFLTTGRPVTVAARKLVAELGCRGMVIIVILLFCAVLCYADLCVPGAAEAGVVSDVADAVQLEPRLRPPPRPRP